MPDIQQKYEGTKMVGAGFVGALGITTPELANLADQAQALTVIFSLLFIVIPTGVWATIRAYQSIRAVFTKDK